MGVASVVFCGKVRDRPASLRVKWRRRQDEMHARMGNRPYPSSIRVGAFGNLSVFTPGNLAGS